MRASTLLAAGAAMFVGLAAASPALAQDYSPLIKPFREGVEQYRDGLPHTGTNTNAKVHLRLDRAIEELYRPSYSVGDDLDRFSRAVKLLKLRRPEQPPLLEDFYTHVNTTIYLFEDLFKGRAQELSDFRVPRGTRTPEVQRGQSLVSRIRLDMSDLIDVARNGGARAAIRWLQRMERRLERAARLMGANPDYTFVEGSVIATTESATYNWTIASASVTRMVDYDTDENGVHTSKEVLWFRLYAHTAHPHSSFTIDWVTVPEPGGDLVGGWRMEGYSVEPDLYPFGGASTFQIWAPTITRRMTLDSIDLDAGAISGSFEYRVDGPGDADFTVMQGTFTITSGLRYRP